MKKTLLVAGIVFCAVSVYGQKMTVKDTDSHVLMEVNDEGTVGSILLEDSTLAPTVTTNKLYNVEGTLYWNGSALGTAGSAGGWMDGGESVYLSDPSDKVGIGTSAPEFRLSVENDGGIIAKGTSGSGTELSTTGSGTRLIWYPRKAAFRVGVVGSTEWNEENIGQGSVAMGMSSNASGEASMAVGHSTTASHYYSTALGYGSTASGFSSTAAGYSVTASGSYASALGWYTNANSLSSVSIGQYNVGGGTTDSWVPADPLFEVGMGQDSDTRANALTVRKNGNLEVSGQMKIAGGSPGTGKVLTSDAAGLATWVTPIVVGTGWTDGGANVYLSTSTDKVGIGTSTPEFKLTLENGGGIIAKGTYGDDSTLVTTGAGTRLIWYPKKAAFRAGQVNFNQWSDANIGNYSIASGYNTTASGTGSVALGYDNTASLDGSVAMGYNNTATEYATAFGYQTHATGQGSAAIGYEPEASGLYSIALGHWTTASGISATAMGSSTMASGQSSTAMGFETTALGRNSTAMGMGTEANAYLSMAIGRYNVGNSTSSTAWVMADPLFEIGNGTTDLARVNALTVLKNGNVGINTSDPSSMLDVLGSIEMGFSDAFYLGDPGTDGSWRFVRNGNNLVFQRCESGAWQTKSTMTP